MVIVTVHTQSAQNHLWNVFKPFLVSVYLNRGFSSVIHPFDFTRGFNTSLEIGKHLVNTITQPLYAAGG